MSKVNFKANDEFERAYGELGALITSAKENDENSVWERIPVNRIRTESLPNVPLLVESIREEFGLPDEVESDTIRDTMENAGLVVKIGEQNQLMRDTARRGLLSRARIFGSALNKVEKEDFCTIVNTCCGAFSDKALVLTRYGKVTGIHSGDEKDYSIMPISELLEALIERLEGDFPGYRFVEGCETHEMTMARFEMPDQRDDLLKEYFKAVVAHGGVPSPDMIPAIIFTSSDTGNSGANVHAVIGNKRYPGRGIRIGTPIKLEHRSKATVKDFEENLKMLFAAFIDQANVLKAMMDISIVYPVETMSRIAKKVGLPAKYSAQAISDYVDMFGSEDMATAHDLYMSLFEAVFLARADGISGTKLVQLEEAASRMLVLEWESFDYPDPKSGIATSTSSTGTVSVASAS